MKNTWFTTMRYEQPTLFWFFKMWKRRLANRRTRALKRGDFEVYDRMNDAISELWGLVGARRGVGA